MAHDENGGAPAEMGHGTAGKTGPADDKKPKDVEIEVNGRAVTMPDKVVTGAEIKQAAISQGVSIQANFVLQQELPNGSSKVVGDTDQIRLHQKLSFTAIAPDDNS